MKRVVVLREDCLKNGLAYFSEKEWEMLVFLIVSGDKGETEFTYAQLLEQINMRNIRTAMNAVGRMERAGFVKEYLPGKKGTKSKIIWNSANIKHVNLPEK